MAKVTTTFVSDEKSVIDAIAKMNAAMEKLSAQNKKLAEDSKKNAENATKGMAAVESSAVSAVAAYVSVSGALRVVNAELEKRYQLESKIRDFQNNAAQSERRFRLNLGFLSQKEQDSATKQLDDLSKRTGVSKTDLYGPVGGALSGTGGDVKKAFQASEAAIRLAKGLPEETNTFAVGIANLQKATGGDVNKAATILGSVGQLSNVKDWSMIARNAPGAIIGGVNQGASLETSTALYASLTQRLGETTGEMSGTAANSFIKQLRDYFPEEDTYTGTGRNRKLKRKGYGKTTTEEQLRMLWGDPKMAKDFVANMTGETKALPAYEQYLTVGSDAQKELLAFTSQVRNDLASNPIPGFQKTLDSGPLQQGLQQDMAMQRVIDKAQESNPEAAYRARVREMTRKALDESGQGFMDSMLYSTGWNVDVGMFGFDPAKKAMSQLREREAGLSAMNQQYGATEERNNQIQVLRDMLGELKKISTQRAANPNANTEGQ